MSAYPEHEKLQAVKGRSQAIGEFLEWYQSEGGGVLAHWLSVRPCPDCEGLVPEVDSCGECGGDGTVPRDPSRLSPDYRSIETLLAAFFKIDLDKIQEEKEAMFQELHRLHKGASP